MYFEYFLSFTRLTGSSSVYIDLCEATRLQTLHSLKGVEAFREEMDQYKRFSFPSQKLEVKQRRCSKHNIHLD